MRVAVVGSGVSGLGAAYALHRAHDVVLFERRGRAGGDAYTVAGGGSAGSPRLDMGFLVHNEATYPALTRLFRDLGVRTQDAEMSFSVTCASCGLVWSSRAPFAQPGNAVRPAFVRFLWEIGRFLRTGGGALARGDLEGVTLRRFAEREGYSQGFLRHYLVPMAAALWSSGTRRATEMPARHVLGFFDNHGLLGLRRLQWKAVCGGSATYVDALLERIGDASRLGLGVRSIERGPGEVRVRDDRDDVHLFDAVVIATHADDALRLLADPDPGEHGALSAFRYTRNETVLHTDPRALPPVPRSWSSWNAHMDDCAAATSHPSVTYSLNRLQRLDDGRPYCVTLNRPGAVDERLVIERATFSHPVFDDAAVAAQARLPALQGRRRTFFAGAYHGNGFHEDGLLSGLRAAAGLGAAG
jgi:predicted NAD/FAD-binding protein